MRQANWYFDFISPYSYFGLFELERLGRDVTHRISTGAVRGTAESLGPARACGNSRQAHLDVSLVHLVRRAARHSVQTAAVRILSIRSAICGSRSRRTASRRRSGGSSSACGRRAWTRPTRECWRSWRRRSASRASGSPSRASRKACARTPTRRSRRCVRRADARGGRRSVLGRGRDRLRARVHRGSQRARQ